MCFQIKEIMLSVDFDAGKEKLNEQNSYTDVIVIIEKINDEGEIEEMRYIAAFFAYQKIRDLEMEHALNGRFLNGKYFYANNMVLVESCEASLIREVVEHLMDKGEFEKVFKQL